jgi:predicted transcriptional regulator
MAPLKIRPDLVERIERLAADEQRSAQDVLDDLLSDVCDDADLDAALEAGAAEIERGEFVEAQTVIDRLRR